MTRGELTMNDEEKIELVRQHVQAVVHSVQVHNRLRRGSEDVANRDEARAARKLLTTLLGRKPTDAEVDEVMG